MSAASVPVPVGRPSYTAGWIGGAERPLEVWSAPPGILMRVAGGSDFYIAPLGEAIMRVLQPPDEERSDAALSELDREILLGPVLVLAQALRGVWSLHASAARFAGKVFVFAGDSGQGKSTLAAYLSGDADWRLVADDIFPVRMGPDGVDGLPHFPQLKLPADKQPGLGLPAQLPIHTICLLTSARSAAMPRVQRLPAGPAVQALLRHTAGARMFTPEMLANHLSFCSRAAGQIPVYRLTYPHAWDALPSVRELLESLC